MKITINFKPQPSLGYEPRKSLTLHNVESVQSNGVHAVQVHNMFNDLDLSYDHVVSVSIFPDKE
jgi:hypothetical protein